MLARSTFTCVGESCSMLILFAELERYYAWWEQGERSNKKLIVTGDNTHNELISAIGWQLYRNSTSLPRYFNNDLALTDS